MKNVFMAVESGLQNAGRHPKAGQPTEGGAWALDLSGQGLGVTPEQYQGEGGGHRGKYYYTARIFYICAQYISVIWFSIYLVLWY